VKRLFVLAAVLVPLTGCSFYLEGVEADLGLPRCGSTPEHLSGALLLAAQSVPTSRWLPCVEELPIGWNVTDLKVRDGRAELTLGYAQEQPQAVRISLTRTCQVRGATEQDSGRPGVRRFEAMTDRRDAYAGQRFDVYPGGCVTYRFDLRGTAPSDAANAISGVLGLVTRDSVRRQFDEHTGGRLQLDPPVSRS
jgi:hypothetical protein